MDEGISKANDKNQHYLVIARKWRPQLFEEVVGQEHVTRTLINAIKSNRVAHAYLLTGPRGVGKTTIARILAKALNCVKGPTTTPCNSCSFCNEITQGTSLDVIEIDGASNRGVDEIRSLRENIRYAPVGGKKKVYIIDEVHMLTQEAFNALLKTLEEPPAHVVFVFATTQPLKVPSTIVSRCQRFDLKRIPADRIVMRLRQICDAEKFRCDDGVLRAIAHRAEGSMRDAQTMLEQVVSFGGGSATELELGAVTGLRGSETIASLCRAIIQGDRKEVLSIAEKSFDQGIDTLDLISAIIEWIRFLLIATIDPNSTQLLSVTEEMREEIRKEAKGVSTEHLLTLLSMISQAEDAIRRSSFRRYFLEVTLLRMTDLKALTNISEIISMIGNMPDGCTENPRQKEENHKEGKKKEEKREEKKSFEPMDSSDCKQATEISQVWQQIIEEVRKERALLASILDLCEPPILDNETYWIEVPKAFHKTQITKRDNLDALTQCFQKITNTSRTIAVRLKGRTGESGSQKLSDAVLQDPFVRMLVEEHGGKILDIRPSDA
ncbi:MAG: DNA polymerase III subunit gamma/tau [bacterium]